MAETRPLDFGIDEARASILDVALGHLIDSMEDGFADALLVFFRCRDGRLRHPYIAFDARLLESAGLDFTDRSRL
jgi:hypothetical protein